MELERMKVTAEIWAVKSRRLLRLLINAVAILLVLGGGYGFFQDRLEQLTESSTLLPRIYIEFPYSLKEIDFFILIIAGLVLFKLSS